MFQETIIQIHNGATLKGLTEGKVVFWYEVVRPNRFIQDAMSEIRQRVAKETGFDVLAGVAR